MSIILYALLCLLCLFLFQLYSIFETVTAEIKKPVVPANDENIKPDRILTSIEFTKIYLGKFYNSTYTCVYYGKVWSEMINISNSNYNPRELEKIIDRYKIHLKNIISLAHENDSCGEYPEFETYRKNVMNSINNACKNIDNRYYAISELLVNIKDKDTKLMSNESETLRQNAINISDLYLKYNTDDDTYKSKVISQLTMIDNYLDRLMNESLLPGTNKYIENELAINQRYLESVIDQDIIEKLRKV